MMKAGYENGAGTNLVKRTQLETMILNVTYFHQINSALIELTLLIFGRPGTDWTINQLVGFH
jgi:hypothetical protein